jgi:hypothetical protein
MTTITHRVHAGVPTGGQFTAPEHPEPAVALPPAPDFDHEFETARGRELTAALQAMPAVPIRQAISASATADLIRDSYGDFFQDGQAPQTRQDAVRSLEAAFPHLTPEERARHIELIRFAVHVQMKHWADTAYVVNPDHSYELLINPDDYADEQDLEENGHDENRSRWETLADTAAFYAISADNSASVKEVVRV